VTHDLPSQGEEVFLFPLAPGQERIWLLDQLSGGTPLFNLNTTARVRATVDVDALARALDEIVRRHEILRTRFRLVDDEPTQVVLPSAGLPLHTVDLTHLDGSHAEAEARAILEDDARRPFDIAHDPLVRTTFVRLSEADALLSVTMHHIVSDGWSIGIFFAELSRNWSGFARGEFVPLPALSIQYGDYALWERERLGGETIARQIEFWRDNLRDAPVFELPSDHPRPAEQSFAGACVPIEIAPELTGAIEALARRSGATPFMALLTAFLVLMHRYTADEDIVLGSYVAGRSRPELEQLLGFFLNTIALRFDLSGDPSFEELLERVRHATLESYEHQDVPFATLVEALRPERDLSRSPICQVVFQMINVPTLVEGDEQRQALVDVAHETAAFDLTCTLWESGAGLRGHIEYCTDLFEQATMARLAAHYRVLLEGIVSRPQERISSLPLLAPAERRLVLEAWNETARPYEASVTIAQLFAEAAERSPDSTAFTCGADRLSYTELDERANRLAHHLASIGAGPETLVGVCLERSLDACVALLAVFKAGAAYLPLDPTYPRERLAFMLADADAAALVTRGALVADLGLDAERVVRVDTDAALIAAQPASAPALRGSADSLAYVIYTSGSTGRPKGVAVEQRQILNRFAWMWEDYPFAPGEIGCQKTPLSFVDSIWEVFGPLLKGVSTAIVPDRVLRDPDELIGELAREGVTRIWLVPSFLRAMLDARPDLGEALPALRFWVSSGEPLPTDLAERFRRCAPDAVLYNIYGTSEVWDATWFDPTLAPNVRGRSPIGRPIANVRAYVLDRRLEPVPVGVAGELYVAGVGVPRGYLNQPELNAARFVPDPFVEGGGLMYATGDAVRYLPDGTIDFLGRSDALVKVRGYRIELGEIEAVLGELPSVRDALVAVIPGNDGERTLGAFIVPDGDGLEPEELRAALRQRLPEHMLPASFVRVDALPLTPSGKRDRLSLPSAPPLPSGTARYVKPATQLEQVIAGIWRELLDVERVGRRENFFDLGGHSLMLFRVQSRLHAAIGVRVPTNDLFRYPTIESLAACCADALAAEPDATPASTSRRLDQDAVAR